jgi:putative ABC transport system permease protein
LPNVTAASTSNLVPGVGSRSQAEFRITELGTSGSEPIVAENRVVSHSYFDTLQIPLLHGERCRLTKNAQESRASPDILVNRSFVERYLPERGVVGLHVSGGFGTAAGRVVGVVGDVRDIGIDLAPAPTVYSCFSAPNPTPIVLLRVKGDALTLVNVVRRKMQEMEPSRAVFNVGTLQEKIDNAFAQSRFRTVLVGAFAVAALLLACLGIYGTLNYTMSLRQREVGLMLALGAARGHIVLKFLREVVYVVLAAMSAGLILLFGLKSVLANLLFGIEPTDPLTLFVVVLLIGVIAILAAVVPVARAAALDPMQTLREQ